MKLLSIVIPVRNEQKRLAMTLSDLHSFIHKERIKAEIILVASPSDDESVDLASRLEQSIPELKLFKLKEDKGKGFAIREGLKNAKGDWVLLMSADNSIQIVELGKALHALDGRELLVATRECPDDGSGKKEKPKCPSFLTRLLLGIKVKDPFSGFKLIPSELAQRVVKKGNCNDHSFDIELILVAKKGGFGIKEFPVSWYPSHEDKPKNPLTLKSFLNIKSRLVKGKYN